MIPVGTRWSQELRSWSATGRLDERSGAACSCRCFGAGGGTREVILAALSGGLRSFGRPEARAGARVTGASSRPHLPRAFDIEHNLAAARLQAAAATRTRDSDRRHRGGLGQVFVSPPFVAHVLAPFSSLPTDVVWLLWTAASLIVLGIATRLVARDTLVARAPMLAFSFVYLWGSLWMGQVNLFALAGLLLALGTRSDRLAGFGLALAVVTRALPGAFAVVLLVERRGRALAWSALFTGLTILIRPTDWIASCRIRGRPPYPTCLSLCRPRSPHTPCVVPAALRRAVVTLPRGGNRSGLLAANRGGARDRATDDNAWHLWLTFAMAPLLLYGEGRWPAALLASRGSIQPIGRCRRRSRRHAAAALAVRLVGCTRLDANRAGAPYTGRP